MKISLLALLPALLLSSAAFACPALDGDFLCAQSSEILRIKTVKFSDGSTQYLIRASKLEDLEPGNTQTVRESGLGVSLQGQGHRRLKCGEDLVLEVFDQDAASGLEKMTAYSLDEKNNLLRGKASVNQPGDQLARLPAPEPCYRIKK